MTKFFKSIKEDFDPIEYRDKFKIFADKFATQAQRDNLIAKNNIAKKDFFKFKNGAGTIATIGASILASSIITPVVRNAVANKFQQRALKREKAAIKPLQTIPYVLPVSSIFNKMKI